MGSGRFTASEWEDYASTKIRDKTTDEIYTSTKMAKEFNPRNIKMRESCDSPDNPNSTPIIIALDVTGSMSSVLEAIAKNLGTLVNEIYERKPVTDPHLMFMGIGDVEAGDSCPLQVTQFEADIRIAEQLTKIYFEGGGGGNDYESYALAWYFAARHTKTDSFLKRKKKGFLFTIGDELPTPYLTIENINKIMDCSERQRLSMESLIKRASEQWNLFHLIIEEGSFCRGARTRVITEWNKAIGQHARPVADHRRVAEIIVSILQKESGVSDKEILEGWDLKDKSAIEEALKYKTSSKESVIID